MRGAEVQGAKVQRQISRCRGAEVVHIVTC